MPCPSWGLLCDCEDSIQALEETSIAVYDHTYVNVKTISVSKLMELQIFLHSAVEY